MTRFIPFKPPQDEIFRSPARVVRARISVNTLHIAFAFKKDKCGHLFGAAARFKGQAGVLEQSPVQERGKRGNDNKKALLLSS
jgi:hypothetical protein